MQQQAQVAGMQLRLLQLLGGWGQHLAQRLGWLAELEQQELRQLLAGQDASAGAATAAAAAAASAPGGSATCMALFPGTSTASGSFLPFNVTMHQLQQVPQ